MENLKQESSNEDQNISNWSDVIKDIVDKLTGKDMEVTYHFDNLQIDMPKATGPEGKEIGSAKWKINGKFTISTQLHEKSRTVE
jgi:hypothetical protein